MLFHPGIPVQSDQRTGCRMWGFYLMIKSLVAGMRVRKCVIWSYTFKLPFYLHKTRLPCFSSIAYRLNKGWTSLSVHLTMLYFSTRLYMDCTVFFHSNWIQQFGMKIQWFFISFILSQSSQIPTLSDDSLTCHATSCLWGAWRHPKAIFLSCLQHHGTE